jgi:hypothetical protein
VKEKGRHRTNSVVMARLPGRDLAGLARWRADSGLGNLLFPWARSVVAAERHGTGMIWPTWPQIALPQLLRREPTRFYYDLFHPRGGRYIAGLEKLKTLARATRASERELNESFDERGANRERKVYEFSGISGYFSEILDDHEMVKDRLFEMTQPHQLEFVENHQAHIAIHVRRGDFSVAGNAQELHTPTKNINIQLPIQWYVYVVQSLRARLGKSIPAVVYSDGKDDELMPLLEIAGTKRAGGRSPLSDLLSLAGAGVLIASGSTFSMWASYLGRMPVIWYPNRIRQRLYSERKWAEIEVGYEEPLAAEFIGKVRELRFMASQDNVQTATGHRQA